jgi:hypothetical protein
MRSTPLTELEILSRIEYLERVRNDLINNSCEEVALGVGAVIHTYKKVLGVDNVGDM